MALFVTYTKKYLYGSIFISVIEKLLSQIIYEINHIIKNYYKINFEIQLIINMSENTERCFGVILAPLSFFFCFVFALTLVAFTHNSKSRRAKKNFHVSLQENLARSAANQNVRTIVAI